MTASEETLLDFWETANKMYFDKDVPAGSDPGKPVAKPACFYAGYCVCNRPVVRAVASSIQRVLRKWFTKGSELLMLLESGMVVL